MTFLPLDLTSPNSIENVLSHIDFSMQYGEDEEPKEVGASLVCSPFPATLPGLVEGQAWIAFLSFMERYVKLTVSPSIHFLVGFITALLIAPPIAPNAPASPRSVPCIPPRLPIAHSNDDPKPILFVIRHAHVTRI